MTDASRDVTARLVPTRLGRLQVCEHAGDEPVLVLMYGFPDDSRIYNGLVPRLSARRAVASDFLDYGGSDRPRPGRSARPAPFFSSGRCATSSASGPPSSTWWMARPAGRNGTGPGPSRS